MKLVRKLVVMTLILSLMLGMLAACKKDPGKAPAPESIAITNTETSIAPGEYMLTAKIMPEKALQEYEFSLLLPVSGATVKDNKLTVTENVDDGAKITVKVKAKYSELVTDKKTFDVTNTVEVDWVDIANEAQLRAALLGENKDLSKNYRLTDHIALAEVWPGVGVPELNATDPLTVPFVGRFNGNGYTISGFNLTHPNVAVEQANRAFFNQVGASGIVEKLTLTGTSVGTKWCSALVGINRGTVRNCVTDVDVTAITEPASGLVGANKTTGKIINSYAVGSVTCGTSNKHGNAFVSAQDGSLERSYGLKDGMPYAVAWNMGSNKSITKSKYDMLKTEIYEEWDNTVWDIREGAYPALKHGGGYVSKPIEKQLVIDDSIETIDYNQGEGEDRLQLKWSIYGLEAGAATTVTVAADTAPPSGITISETGLITVSSTVRDKATVTVVVTSVADPTLTDTITVKVSSPVILTAETITTAARLKEIFETTDANLLTGTYLLGNDIDCSTINLTGPFGFKSETKSTLFTGTFDGQGYALKNLKYAASTATIGLFGTIGETGIVKRLGIEIGTDGMRVGTASGVIAATNKGLIEDCYVTGTVWTHASFVGGFVSGNEGTIRNSYSLAKVYVKCTVNGTTFNKPTDPANFISAPGVWDNKKTGILTNVFANAEGEIGYTAKFPFNPNLGTITNSGLKTTAEMQTEATYADWNKDVWTITAGQYPVLKKVTA